MLSRIFGEKLTYKVDTKYILWRPYNMACTAPSTYFRIVHSYLFPALPKPVLVNFVHTCFLFAAALACLLWLDYFALCL